MKRIQCRYRLSWYYYIVIIFILFIRIARISPINAWEWSDLVVSTSSWGKNNNETTTMLPFFSSSSSPTSLSIQEISELRVRDIKRRLSRTHGYSAEELNKVLDKKELIQSLAFEEEKVRLLYESTSKRIVIQQTIIIAIITTVIILCWPLLSHAYEVIMINMIVYTDRKKVEAKKCYELQSYYGILGVLCMSMLDMLQIWLTISVLSSWITSSKKYSFPIPQITIRPGQFMGGDIANSSVGNYGINVGSMLITYGLRFIYGKIEYWTGIVLLKKAKQQHHEARQNESVEERTTRKAVRNAMKEEALYRQQQQQQQYAAMSTLRRPPPPPPPPEWVAATSQSSTMNNNISIKIAHGRQSHQEFLHELNETSINNTDDDDNDEYDNIFDSITDDNNTGNNGLQSPISSTMEELD